MKAAVIGFSQSGPSNKFFRRLFSLLICFKPHTTLSLHSPPRRLPRLLAGFERVFPLHWLALFHPTELGQLISGESGVQWSHDELLTYTVPCYGYTRDSVTYQMLITVLSDFSTLERRAFLQFTTGCSSLPPGGLKNLHPPLSIVRKDTDGAAYPSVNTCMHYLKLPPYRSETELRTALLRATQEVGFYFN